MEAQNATNDESQKTAHVAEQKFNATATLSVKAESERMAENVARDFFKDKHGSRPSKVVVSEDDHQMSMDGENIEYTVMVADHSSGSLVESETYNY